MTTLDSQTGANLEGPGFCPFYCGQKNSDQQDACSGWPALHYQPSGPSSAWLRCSCWMHYVFMFTISIQFLVAVPNSLLNFIPPLLLCQGNSTHQECPLFPCYHQTPNHILLKVFPHCTSVLITQTAYLY